MDERVEKELKSGKLSKFHEAVLEHAKALVELSRSRMNKYYCDWDDYDDIYRGERYPDKTDLERRKKDEPEKMVVPMAFAQVQTFVAFCILLFTQREFTVELQAQGPEDEPAARLGEALMERDLRANQFVARLKQFLTDIARFGFGVLKHSWSHETQLIRSSSPMPGSEMITVSEIKEVTKFLGNRVENISPYRFFPDPRVPLSKLQDGEFCADEDEVSIISLRKLEKDGVVAGVDQIKPWSQIDLNAREGKSRLFSQTSEGTTDQQRGQTKGMCLRTEVQVKIVPKDFTLEDGKPLGEEDYPVHYVVTYVNDETVIRCEPMNYLHNEFTYDLAEFNPDLHHLVNTSLSEIIDMLQNTISWFINSRITNVRRVIQNRLVYDPSAIEDGDLKKDTPHIRMSAAYAGADVRRFLYQLQLQDVTTGHITDVEVLKQIMMEVTSISENGLGQYASGRRSAEEARNVNYNAASRMKVIAMIIYETGLEPLFRKMLSNLRDGLDEETYVRVKGMAANPEEYMSFKATRENLVGNYDFKVFDATLPSEKGYMASQLGEMLTAMMSNPEAIPLFGYDPRKLFDKMFELRGVKNLESLKLDPVASASLMATQQQVQNGPVPGAQGEVQPGGAAAVPGPAASEPNLQNLAMFG